MYLQSECTATAAKNDPALIVLHQTREAYKHLSLWQLLNAEEPKKRPLEVIQKCIGTTQWLPPASFKLQNSKRQLPVNRLRVC